MFNIILKLFASFRATIAYFLQTIPLAYDRINNG